MKTTDDSALHSRPDCIRAISMLLLGILFGVFVWTGHAYAEGSRTLYPASYPTTCGTGAGQGCRADLDLEAALAPYVGQVTRSTFLYVYAQAGEYIVLGSANRSNGGDIYVYNPQNFGVPGAENYNAVTPGTPDFTCSGGSTQPGPHFFGGTLGTIANRTQELVGPNSADNSVPVTNGFAPCAYLAPVTGSYGVLFFAAPGGAGAPDGNITPLIIDGVGVSAWDVTVRANRTSTTDINGSLYTYAFIGYTGGNSRPIYSSLYYVTRDGYRYRQDLDGMDGNGYALYSNSLGFLDSGQPLYKDLRGNDSQVSTSLPIGITTQTAENPTFFSDISPAGANAAQVNIVLSSLNIPLVPPSPTVSNVDFIGNVTGSTSYLGTGGTFTFDTSYTITYQIVISLDGVNFDPANATNKTLTGLAPAGSHTVIWDGTNNSGANFPAGGPYPFQVSGRNGEVHFPMIDVENNYFGGPTITRLNGAGAPSTTVYYDDRGYVVSSGVAVGTLNGILCPTTTPPQPVPAYSLVGIDSSTSYRTWGVLAGTSNTNFDCTSTNAWGDAKAVNLWTYYSFTPALQTLTVISVNVDVATGVAGPVTVTSGSTVQGTFTFANNGTAIAHGVTYTMSLSPGLGVGGVTFGNLPTGTTATYNNATGVVTFGGTDLPTTLTAGQAVVGANPTAPMTYSYTAPASGSVTVSTQIATSDTDSVPSNNSDSITTYIGTVDVQTTVTVLSTAAPNGTVTGNIQFTNNGTSDATGVTYTATIGNSSFYPALITFTSIPTGVTPSYNSTTGVITFTGLPSTLGSSQTFNIGFSYTAPSSGVIPVSSAITTTSTDVNPANNNSIAYTYVGPDLTVTKSHTGNFTQGQTGAQYTISVANAGSLATNGTTVTVTDTLPAGLTATAISGTGWTCVLGTLTCTRSDALAAGASYPNITLTVNVAAGAGSPLVNNVSVSGGGDVKTTNNTDTDSTTVNVNGPDLIVAKSHVGIFYQGQNGAQYTITVSNVGSAATNGTTVTVTDTLPAGLTATAISGTGWTCVLGTLTCTRSDALAAGASYPNITLTVNVAAGAGSPLVNNVSVSGGGDVKTTNNTATDSTTVTAGGPDLTVTKSHTGNFTQGQNGATYTIIVTNSGTAVTTGRATVTDTLPAGLTFVSGTGTNWNACTAVGQVVTCRQSLGQTINAGASAAPITLTVNVASNAATPQVNTVTVSGGGETYTANDTATDSTIINQLPDLTITKSHSDPFYSGQTGATYTITVSNVGGGPTTGTVTVTDTLPTTYLTATAISGTGWTCTLATLICTRSDVLAAGASYPAITLTVTVAGNAYRHTPQTNSVAVSGGGETNTANDTANDVTNFVQTAPDLTVTKSHAGNFSQGQNGATYTITVSNVGNAATTAAVTVTDTLPIGLTYVSGAGTGWTGNCGALGQVVTCTRSDVLAAGSSYPALTLTVNVAGNAGSPQVNSVTVGGGGETNTANDTATDSTTVTVSLLPDLTLTKTHIFYGGETGVQFTLTVSNIGTAATTGTITVTDTLPTGLTYVSAAGTGWTCGAVGQVVTCTSTTAIAVNGSGNPITLDVSVAGNAPYTMINNASVSLTGQSESNYNNNIGSDTVTIAPTLVTLIDFQAYNDNGHVVVQWETSSEHNTLGFYIYRLDAATGQYRSLTQGLLPGLMTFPIGGTYTINDSEAIPGEVYQYELVEVETNGKQITYGPFNVTVGEKTEANSLGPLKSSATASVAGSSSLPSGYSRKKHEQSALQESRLQASKALRESTRLSAAAITPAGSRIKIAVSEDGIYYMDANDIASLLGIRSSSVSFMIAHNQLSVSNQGKPVSYLPAQNNTGIYFYGIGTDSVYTRDNIYWIDTVKGKVMNNEKGRKPSPTSDNETFTDTLHVEQDLIANMQVNDPNVDYWAWDLIFLSPSYSDLPEDFTFTVNGKADTQATATMQVHLVGGSDTGISPDHHVIVSLNGQQIGEGRWGGLTSYTLTATFSQSLINEGENAIEVAGVLDPGIPWSMFLIDSFDLTYERLYVASGNSLFFSGDGNQTVTVGGFTSASPNIFLFDVTDSQTPKLETATAVDGSPGNYRISFKPVSADALYLAVANDAVTNVGNGQSVSQSSLHSKNYTVDYLIIAPEELMSAVQPLAAYRQAQGMKTMVVNVDDIMNEFNFGLSSPEAIRQFLSYAYYNWKRAPRYVLLAGAGTWDYRDNLGKGGNLIPPALVPTPTGLTTSDNHLGDVNGDHMPEMAIGRLPVLVPDDLTNIIGKIKTFESSRGSQTVLLADNPDDGGDFTADSEAIAAFFPLNYVLEKVYLAEHSADDAETMLSAYLNSGSVFFNYIGHGGIDVLSNLAILSNNGSEYPDALQVDSLVNGYGLPVMVAMTCTIGDFAVPGYLSLSESMLLKSGGGAAAVWSATGLSVDAQAKVLNKEFYKAVFSSGKKVLGDAVLQALTRYGAVGSMPFMMEMYTIIGDPALRIK